MSDGIKSKATIAEYDLERSKRLWGRIQFEIGLLVSRINWLVTINAIAFSGALISINSSVISDNFIYLFGLISICFSILTFFSVLASANVISICRDELALLKNRYPVELQDDVDRAENVPALRRVAILNNYAPMIIFLVAWCALMANQLLSLNMF